MLTIAMGLTSVFLLAIIIISRKSRRKSLGKIRYRQSSIHEMVKDVLPKEVFDKPNKMTQSKYHAQKNMMKVVMTEGKAYWVVDNVFYTAKAIDGRIDSNTVKPLDVQNMSKKELDKMLSILDSLRNGEDPNASGSSGN